MACQNPIIILSPESRLLKKCRQENRSFEYYQLQSRQRRNLLYDPYPLATTPEEYYGISPNGYRVMSVPCGKCELCLKSRVDSYFVRNYFEWMWNKFFCKGSAWFITLTYEDSVLPKVIPNNEFCRKKQWCFSKPHIQLFLKRLRKYSGLDFKYFIVTEFGGEFGRPHYHGLLYIRNFAESESNRFRLIELIANSWTKINDRNHKMTAMREYNLFDVQRVDVQLLNSSKGLRYCCKYVGKQLGASDFDLLSIPDINKRFHLQSIGLGEHYLEFCNKDLWEKGYIEIDGFKYRIPDYYRTKVMREFYCEHENGSIIYRPTDFKLQYISELSLKQIHEHMSLALLNPDYPEPPAWVYNPAELNLFYSFLKDYLLFRDVPNYDIQTQYISSWTDYLFEVQKYNKSKFDAQAAKWRKQQNDHYLKKIGMK